MSDSVVDIEAMVSAALSDDLALEELKTNLSCASRRTRQYSATALCRIVKADPARGASCIAALVDAVNRPEAQTRWECLEALSMLVSVDSRGCDKALAGAEAALFDEGNGLVRLAAMRFLCTLGSTTENRSERTWPLIDEAIQCYHGDPEFQDMLLAVTDFSTGKLSASVKTALAERMSFDATNSKGALKRRAALIVENVS